MSGPEFNPADDQPIDREEWERAMTGTAPTPESKCPVCRTANKWSASCIGFGAPCTHPWHVQSESKQEWCVTTARKAFVKARAEQLDAEIVSESKPNSEGARTCKFCGVTNLNHSELCPGAWAFKIGCLALDKPASVVMEKVAEYKRLIEEPFRSQLAAAEKERDEALNLIGPPDHLLCDNIQGHPRICHCADPLYWKSAAQRLRERIAELEGSK